MNEMDRRANRQGGMRKMNEDVAESVKAMCDDVLKSWEEPTIEVKYHDGASKLVDDVHGVM